MFSFKSTNGNSVGTQTLHYVSYNIPRSDYQLPEIRPHSYSNFHFHRDGISNLFQHCQSSTSKSSETIRNNHDHLSENIHISQSFPFSFGTTQCSSGFCNARQTTSPTIANVPALPMETTKIFTESPNQDITNILHHLDWWKQEEIYQQGVPLRINPPSHTIFTDASLSGWGSHVEPEGLLFHGVWTEAQSQLHINMLEMMAISMALKEALHTIKNSTVLVSEDNTTVVAYLRKQGGTRSPDLCLEVWEILNWCFQIKIQLLIKQ